MDEMKYVVKRDGHAGSSFVAELENALVISGPDIFQAEFGGPHSVTDQNGNDLYTSWHSFQVKLTGFWAERIFDENIESLMGLDAGMKIEIARRLLESIELDKVEITKA